jgi:DNA-binding transcriptional LysR family regulator
MAPPPDGPPRTARRSPALDPRLTVHQLRRLVAVADHGSISAAAAALFLAQPALSKSMLELERTLGTRLFARTNRGTVLSPAGERAVRMARAILADVRALEELTARETADGSRSAAAAAEARPAADAAPAAAEAEHPPHPQGPAAEEASRRPSDPEVPSLRGTAEPTAAAERTPPAPAPLSPLLRIAATPTLAGDLGTHLIPTFAIAHPDIPVRLTRSSSRAELFASLRTGDADLGVAALPAPADLIACQFAVREVVLLSPDGVDLPDPASPADLDGLPLVLPPPGTGRREEIDAFFTAMGITPVVALEAEERSAWIAAVRAGVGSVFLYRDMIEHLGHPGTVVRDFHPPVRGRIALLHRPDTPASRTAPFLTHARALGLRPTPPTAVTPQGGSPRS